MCNMQNVMKFEEFPNEILIECFEYFHSADLFYSFGQLNHRFNQLIEILPLRINFQNIDKLLYDKVCEQMLSDPDAQLRVYSLHLSNENTPGQIEYFLSRFALDQFAHLRSLTLIDLKENNIEALQEILPLLSQITTLNILDSKLELYELEFVLPIDTLHALSINSNMAFVQETIPIKCLTLSTISLNDICRLFQYTPLLEYLTISRVPMEVFSWEYRRRSRPVHLKYLNLVEFDLHFNALADFVQRMSNLRSFTISSSRDGQTLEASRWEELIIYSFPSLKNFRFRLEIKFHLDRYTVLKISEKFRTDFWLKEHQWYTECVSSIVNRVTVIYTIPYLSQWKQLPLQSTRYCFVPSIDHKQTFKNITRLVASVDDIFEHGKYYFPNVTSLVIKDSLVMMNRAGEQKLEEYLKTLINLSNLKHLEITVECQSRQPSVLFTILRLAPQLSSLTPRGCFYQSLTTHPELSRYLTEKIRKLDVDKYYFCEDHRSVIIHSLCKVIPNLEQLTTYLDDADDLLFLFNCLSNTSCFSVRFKLTDHSQQLEMLEKQLTEQNALFHESTSLVGDEFFIDFSVWMRKNV